MSQSRAVDFQAVAVQAARAAGEVALHAFGQRIQADYKQDLSPVTAADRQAEQAAIATLRAATPDYGILAEESGEHELGDRPYWVIDPIDGTRNFSRGMRYFASGVALVADGITQVAAVFLPALDELYAAERGKGATCNGSAIHSAPATALDQAIVAFSASRTRRIDGEYQAVAATLMPLIGSPRILASSLLQCCFVANGQVDAFVGFHTKPWDILPGMLIAQEAGVVAITFDGQPWVIDAPTMILGAPSVAAELAELLVQPPPTTTSATG